MQDVPYMGTLDWSISSRLKDVMNQFQKHLDNLQEFWSVLDDIDKSLCVVDAKQPSRASPVRRIHAANCLDRCRFIGPVPLHMNDLWRRNSKKWSKEKPFPENLECILGTELPKRTNLQAEDHHQQIECGICYAQFLPTDEELGARSGTRTHYTCENISCNKSFHSICLTDWLRSITTTRQSFDVLFGNCPYCSDPVAVKINNK
ncbi:unnamed protein product [Arabis nemorensis]|uniref:FANCL C-terminal domain-containing protein n=1 Tax=Arabis nemorensis TaxID=586526 RepID=A0A565CWT6_9BRAS|nr:unnamed protein product [Arabis nemorensis]